MASEFSILSRLPGSRGGTGLVFVPEVELGFRQLVSLDFLFEHLGLLLEDERVVFGDEALSFGVRVHSLREHTLRQK